MKKENQKLLTVKDISKRLKINQSTIYTILHYDRLNYETVGNLIVVREDTFNDWMAKNIKSTKEESKDVAKI